ncbi:MAG: DUF3786 domain-containing protein [bacterium]|nr:DUF3786 domain-containing protein [bacterium]
MEERRRETYAVALEQARRDFAARDPDRAAREAGGSREGSAIILRHFNTLYVVDHPSGRVCPRANPGQQAGEVTRLLVLHYLITTRGAEPRGRWISFREVPGGDVYLPAFNRRSVAWLVRRFGEDPAGLVEAGVRLGGQPAGIGDAAITLHAFPLVPVTLVLWRGDDEIPTAGNVLFDETAPLHLPTEDLAVVAGETMAVLSRKS